jgi:hypothetical protein
MTMWRDSEAAEEDVSDISDIDWQNERRRSRRAWRGGLADQTVVRQLEDIRSYRVFERALVGSVDPRSVLELALAHRLASLLWRLRRASAIETGLFEIQGPRQPPTLQTPAQSNGHKTAPGRNGRADSPAPDLLPTSMRPPPTPWSKSRAIAQCFLRLSRLDPTLLDRVGSYETRLWRQAAQTIWTLEAVRRPSLAPARRPFRKPVVFSY